MDDLGRLVDFLRSRGVVSYSGGGIALSLLPEAPALRVEEPRQVVEPERKRKDGLTPSEQIVFYGRVIDEE